MFKRSGSGYQKRWGGFAWYSSGYDYFYSHILPSEVQGVKDDWSKFDETSEKACKDSPPICPCLNNTEIWVTGSVEIVGSFDTVEELDPYRCDTNQYYPYYIICDMWTISDKNYWDDMINECSKY